MVVSPSLNYLTGPTRHRGQRGQEPLFERAVNSSSWKVNQTNTKTMHTTTKRQKGTTKKPELTESETKNSRRDRSKTTKKHTII